MVLCFENYEQFLTARPSILVTDCKSLYDAIHKEGAAPASTDKRLAIELAIVKAKAVAGETDLRWIDARYKIADCLTKTRFKKVRGSPPENSAGSTVENYCRRRYAGQTQQCSLRRRVVAYERMISCRQEKIFEECESGCAYDGITDSVTNTLMKVQHVAVSENSVTTTVFRVR